MIEEKFSAAQDCPIDVLQHGPTVFFTSISESLNHLFLFGGGGWPTKGIEIIVADSIRNVAAIDGELAGNVGNLSNRIVHDFSHQAAGIMMRIEARIGGVLGQSFA